MEAEVDEMVQTKKSDFSFEISSDWEDSYFKELDDVQNFIDQTLEAYKMLKKLPKKSKEIKEVREKIIETMYAKKHLKMVMNMDFERPTEKMRKMAKDNNIDLNDSAVINEFKKI